jgi:5-methylcytosine-specific restriction endonuclease McrA
MNKKEFDKYLQRDNYKCCHCGLDDDTLVPQHRKNRGFGGSKERDKPSNILTFCSAFNTLIESSAEAARAARMNGWKLDSWDDPTEVPFYSGGAWYILTDDFGRFQLLNYDFED